MSLALMLMVDDGLPAELDPGPSPIPVGFPQPYPYLCHCPLINSLQLYTWRGLVPAALGSYKRENTQLYLFKNNEL
jgi:hypothetical protein